MIDPSARLNEQDVETIFRETDALRTGHFELRSKLHSDRFFQCAMVLQYPAQTARLCAELAQRIQSAGISAETVISPAMGGLFVGHELARSLNLRSIFVEKVNDRLTLRRGFTLRSGETFIVAEDVITRGGRVRETLDIVRAAGGRVQAVAVLVDRSGGKAAFDVPCVSLLRMSPQTWEPSDCPLCRQSLPLEHPGS